MAELPIVAFCLAGINFVLSTSPAMIKLGHTIDKRRDQIKRLRDRLEACNRRYSLLLEYRNGLESLSSPQSKAINGQILNVLSTQIEEALEKQLREQGASRKWPKIKKALKQGKLFTPDLTPQLWRSIQYALWERELLEGWIKELETAIGVEDDQFKRDMDLATANFFNKRQQMKEPAKLNVLSEFVTPLWELISEIYEEGTRSWSLRVQKPSLDDEEDDISSWEYSPVVHVQVRFSDQKTQSSIECTRKCVYYNPQDTSASTVNSIPNSSTASTVLCTYCAQNPLSQLSSSLGKILQQADAPLSLVFWRSRRADAVLGITHWALLLWNTPWFKELCSHKLVFEEDTSSPLNGDPWFKRGKKGQCIHEPHTDKYRDLGIIIAELILGFSIKPRQGGTPLEYEFQAGERWENITVNILGCKILARTCSDQLRRAVQFCLDPKSRDELLRSDDEFLVGFLFGSIERIFKPVKEWHTTTMSKQVVDCRQKTLKGKQKCFDPGNSNTQDSEHYGLPEVRLPVSNFSPYVSSPSLSKSHSIELNAVGHQRDITDSISPVVASRHLFRRTSTFHSSHQRESSEDT